MLNNKTFLAIIPARGGSKRLPRKNLLDLCGKPLIAWSIDAGKKSKYIDKVLVSSEDNEILDTSSKFEAHVLKRPENLSSDTSTTFEVVEHALQHSDRFDFVVLLQPTSPLRTEVHIDSAIELLFEKNADGIISVSETDHNPLWSNTLDDRLSMKNFLSDDVHNKRSQDLDKFYRLNGGIYICKIDELLKQKSFFLRNKIFAYKMDRESSVDVDEEIDFKIAQTFMTNKYV